MSLVLLKGLSKIKNLLANFSPQNEDDAIGWFHFRSFVNSKDIGDRLTAEATDLLEDSGILESESGLKVQRIAKKIRVWKETPEVLSATEAVEKAQASLDKAKERLDKVREKAGFEEKDGKPYYQIVK